MAQKAFVFRTSDEEKKWLAQELFNGTLRQGWGISGTSLKSNDSEISLEKWIPQYIAAAHVHWQTEVTPEQAAKRYGILRPMLEVEEGDLLVIPKMPTWGTFTVCEAATGYSFDERDSKERDGYDDFRHTISVKTDSMKRFGHKANEQSRVMASKFRAYQSAINRVWNTEAISAIQSLFMMPSDESRIAVETVLQEQILPDLTARYIEKLISLGPKEVESAVHLMLEKCGYEIAEVNHYDSEGGDADIIATRSLPFLSEVCQAVSKLYVQVKAKSGTDWNDVAGVKQLQKITEGEIAPHHKILVSTATEFTTECKVMAEECGVVLVNGHQLLAQLIKYI
jgi:Holliday junction resolvase-like predicted endonuclease